MTEKDVVKAILNKRKWSQADLAKEAGFKSQSDVTGYLNRGKNGIRTDILIRMAHALGCEVVIRDKMVKGQEWVLDMESEDNA